MNEPNPLIDACERYHEYPENLNTARWLPNQITKACAELEARDQPDSRLFEDDDGADVECWQCSSDKHESRTHLSSLNQMRLLLEKSWQQNNSDPLTRILFIGAKNSRSPLRITNDMFKYFCTYHEVSPGFLKHVIPFGEQIYPRDFHFVAFKQDSSLHPRKQTHPLSKLGRSGKEIRIWFTIKAVEPSPRETFPWSIRQLAVYLSFDARNGKSTWIFVKGNDVMKVPVTEVAGLGTTNNQSANERLRSTLQILLVCFEWIMESWSGYINFLEAEFQSLTRKALWTELNPKLVPQRSPILTHPPKSSTWKTITSIRSRHGKPSLTTTAQDQDDQKYQEKISSSSSSPPLPRDNKTLTPTTAIRPQQLAREFTSDVMPLMKSAREMKDQLYFEELQRVHQSEEKVQEAVVVLSLDHKVLVATQRYFEELQSSRFMPQELKDDTIPDFSDELSHIDNELDIILSRYKALEQLMQNRKALIFGILEFSSMEASKTLSEKGHHTAENMHLLTEKMHWIAKKTLNDTVSMKIITLVTLFYLPGTFMSTIMSSELVKYDVDSSTGRVSRRSPSNAVVLYLSVTIPLMVGTFFAWWVVKQIERRRQRWIDAEPSIPSDGDNRRPVV